MNLGLLVVSENDIGVDLTIYDDLVWDARVKFRKLWNGPNFIEISALYPMKPERAMQLMTRYQYKFSSVYADIYVTRSSVTNVLYRFGQRTLFNSNVMSNSFEIIKYS